MDSLSIKYSKKDIMMILFKTRGFMAKERTHANDMNIQPEPLLIQTLNSADMRHQRQLEKQPMLLSSFLWQGHHMCYFT